MLHRMSDNNLTTFRSRVIWIVPNTSKRVSKHRQCLVDRNSMLLYWRPPSACPIQTAEPLDFEPSMNERHPATGWLTAGRSAASGAGIASQGALKPYGRSSVCSGLLCHFFTEAEKIS